MIRTPLSKNSPHWLSVFVMLCCLAASAQQKPNPSLPFCGLHVEKKSFFKRMYSDQYRFLRVNDNDTIVDIGSSSGSFAGAFSAAMDVKNVTFVLVDIDSNCLNARMVENMKAHYSKVKGSPITNQFVRNVNTADSLWLPPGSFSKAWLINTLHEIPGTKKMVQQIAEILRKGGEQVLLEWLRVQPGQKHGGFNLPLISDDEIAQLFAENGFTVAGRYDEKGNKRKHIMMMRFIRN